MSGIVGILRTDGAPIDPKLIQRLTASLALRGPDKQDTWSFGRVALGHALFRTTDEAEHERQPLTLDGQVWIVADARVDARQDLIHALGHNRERISSERSDAELILRAYLRWGEECVEHLLGDFAFAIWDNRQQRLFCARDHMGVKPFYYACVGRSVIFASALEALRLHPQVSDRLNDLAIADFLLFGFNQDHATTSFEDIQRLPPAHTLTWSESSIAIRRYWTLPIEEPLYLRQDSDYVDLYRALVRQAVSDRLRTDRVSVFMSGGLDSSGLAASALDVLDGQATPKPVKAFTFVYDRLIPDSEREYAGMVAAHLGIPICFYPLDEDGWYPEAAAETPEPTVTLTNRTAELRAYSDMAGHSRVAFHGEGPDNALVYEWEPHLRYLIRNRRVTRLAADLVKHLIAHKRVPIVPTIPRMIRDRRGRLDFEPVFPPWIASDLVDRLQLVDRWQRFYARAISPHPVRPRGYKSLLTAQWQSLFETLEPAYTGVSMEVRHPYVDIRVLRFLLRVPAIPWCRVKRLQRESLRGVVPEAVRRRPKSPLTRNPGYVRSRRHGLPTARRSDALEAYGSASKLSLSNTVSAVESDLGIVTLSHWLAGRGSTIIRQKQEEDHGQAVACAGRP